MKGSHAGVLLSIAGHVAIVMAVAVHAITSAPVPRIDQPPSSISEPIIEVEYFASEPPMMPVEPNTHSGAVAKPRAVRMATEASASPAAVSSEQAGLLAMRTRPPPRTEAAARTEAPVAPALPSIRESADQLSGSMPSPAHLPNAETPAAPSSVFTMHVEPDGTAHIKDRRNFNLGIGRDSAIQREVGRAEWWLEEHHERSNAIELKVPPVGPSIATFDMTDWAMRAAGQDPYAAQKLAQLDATRDQRAQIGMRHHEQQLVQVPALVRASMDEISRLPEPQRKAALGQLWRDCDQTSFGDLARSTITAYAREHFTEEERAELR